MGLHRLFREEKAVPDLTVDEPLRDQLEDFDLPCGRLLLQLLEGSREGNDLARTARRPPLSDGLESPRVVHVATEDLFALSSVHDPRIGSLWTTLTPPFEGCPEKGLDERRLLDLRPHQLVLDHHLPLLRLDPAGLDVLCPVARDEMAV